MTEYQKLLAVKNDLSTRAAALSAFLLTSGSASLDGAATITAHRSLGEAEEALGQWRGRMAKMVVRARETHPDKQMYNEAMCAKIEALALEFEAADAALAAAADGVVEAFAAHVAALAATEAWQRRVAASAADVAERETEQRALAAAAEIAARRPLVDAARVARADAAARAAAREAAAWAAETARRAAEARDADAVEAAARGGGDAADDGAVPAAVARRLWDETAVALGGNAAAVRVVLRRVAALLDASARDPDNAGVRHLRNNNPALVRDFGHPCDVATRAVYSAVEGFLFAAGYRPRYSAAPVPPLPESVLEQSTVVSAPAVVVRAASRVGGAVAADAADAGGWLQRRYVPLGHEPYGERFLTLREPDAAQDSAAWMLWFDASQRLRGALAALLQRP